MELTLGLLADAANRADSGKLNVLGVFTTIHARAFPARHPKMELVLQFTADPVERGQQKNIEVTLVDQDGEALVVIRGKAMVPQQAPAGAPVQMLSQLPLTDVVFQRAGRHAFVVTVNGETKGRVELELIEGAPARAEGGR